LSSEVNECQPLPVTRTVGSSSSPCVNATCVINATSFSSDDVAVHSNASLLDTSRVKASLETRSGTPSVEKRLTVPLGSGAS